MTAWSGPPRSQPSLKQVLLWPPAWLALGFGRGRPCTPSPTYYCRWHACGGEGKEVGRKAWPVLPQGAHQPPQSKVAAGAPVTNKITRNTVTGFQENQKASRRPRLDPNPTGKVGGAGCAPTHPTHHPHQEATQWGDTGPSWGQPGHLSSPKPCQAIRPSAVVLPQHGSSCSSPIFSWMHPDAQSYISSI